MRRLLLAGAFATLCAPVAAQEDYSNYIKRVQEALIVQGFLPPGRLDGRDEGNTQAALARFQLANGLPASGSLDPDTVKALGVVREGFEESASAGGSRAPELVGATPETPGL